MSAHALHLLQASLVYVNTRMVQSVLSEPGWATRLSERDYHGLTPLIYSPSIRMAGSMLTWTSGSTLGRWPPDLCVTKGYTLRRQAGMSQMNGQPLIVTVSGCKPP
ncbi:Tn3 family transposase [Ruegeria sp. HKCCA4008]|uniref:Tn3 family transposase n=1 Tax=Ruegeria sp. HKCCA4008 TaxID=2682999 RepID=UPI00353006C9